MFIIEELEFLSIQSSCLFKKQQLLSGCTQPSGWAVVRRMSRSRPAVPGLCWDPHIFGALFKHWEGDALGDCNWLAALLWSNSAEYTELCQDSLKPVENQLPLFDLTFGKLKALSTQTATADAALHPNASQLLHGCNLSNMFLPQS